MSRVEHLREVVEEGGEKIVVEPLRTAGDLEGDEVGQEGDDEQVAQDRGPRDPVGLGPPLLEPELAAEVDESLDLLLEEDLLDADEAALGLHFPLDPGPGRLDAVNPPVELVDDAELPAGVDMWWAARRMHFSRGASRGSFR